MYDDFDDLSISSSLKQSITSNNSNYSDYSDSDSSTSLKNKLIKRFLCCCSNKKQHLTEQLSPTLRTNKIVNPTFGSPGTSNNSSNKEKYF